MIFEIINPSDPYTIEADGLDVACVANMLLGEGAYGLRQIDGDNQMPILLFGFDEWFMKTFGAGFELVLKRCVEDKKDCLIKTFDSVLIGDIRDRRTFYDGLNLIDDAQKRQEWRNRWNSQRKSSMNDIASVAYHYASALRKVAAKTGSDYVA